MTTIFFVRHAVHDLIGKVLAGRMPGVGLGPAGHAQCERLADRLARAEIAAIYTSPLQRTRETAASIGRRLGLAPEPCEAIAEVDYGEWTGLPFDLLERDPRWDAWNRAKATNRPPGGETLLDVQHRAIRAVESAAAAHPASGAVLVSHGDVIRSALAYYLGVGIEGIARFEISPASISTLAIGAWGAKVHSLNEVAAP